jgi:hypothetical protein
MNDFHSQLRYLSLFGLLFIEVMRKSYQSVQHYYRTLALFDNSHGMLIAEVRRINLSTAEICFFETIDGQMSWTVTLEDSPLGRRFKSQAQSQVLQLEVDPDSKGRVLMSTSFSSAQIGSQFRGSCTALKGLLPEGAT